MSEIGCCEGDASVLVSVSLKDETDGWLALASAWFSSVVEESDSSWAMPSAVCVRVASRREALIATGTTPQLNKATLGKRRQIFMFFDENDSHHWL